MMQVLSDRFEVSDRHIDLNCAENIHSQVTLSEKHNQDYRERHMSFGTSEPIVKEYIDDSNVNNEFVYLRD